MVRPKITITEDGSPTLRHPLTGDTYHSMRGAVGEALHVFVREGFSYVSLFRVRILEIGLGSGLNALLTARAAAEQNRSVEYTAVEPYPVTPDIVSRLDYAADPLFLLLHEAPWNERTELTPHFSLKKIEASLLDYRFDATFDLIYFDAFAPDTQPEMWSRDVFTRLYDSLSPGGVLVTYSAKGTVKENLRAAGFEVRRLKGALGKRHMVRAAKPERGENPHEPITTGYGQKNS